MLVSPLFIQIYLDEDVHPNLAVIIRQQGHDCQNASEVGMIGKSDEEQLRYVASQGRTLLTFNVADFAVLARQWTQTSQTHAGIIVPRQVSQRGLGQLLQRILQLPNTYTADEMRDTFLYL